MYYYIADPPASTVDQKIISAIRTQLIPLGIAGEFVFRTPGGSAAKLTKHALSEGFTTVVAIGDDLLASEIASVMYDQPAALGIIPIGASPSLTTTLGYSDWKQGISALRHRRLIMHDIGSLNGDFFFMTDLCVKATQKTDFYIHTDRFSVLAQTDYLDIRLSSSNEPFNIPGVIHLVIPKQKNAPIWIKPFLGKPYLNIETLVRSETAVIQTESEAKIEYLGNTLMNTPVSISVIPQSVRLIITKNHQDKTD